MRNLPLKFILYMNALSMAFGLYHLFTRDGDNYADVGVIMLQALAIIMVDRYLRNNAVSEEA